MQSVHLESKTQGLRSKRAQLQEASASLTLAAESGDARASSKLSPLRQTIAMLDYEINDLLIAHQQALANEAEERLADARALAHKHADSAVALADERVRIAVEMDTLTRTTIRPLVQAWCAATERLRAEADAACTALAALGDTGPATRLPEVTRRQFSERALFKFWRDASLREVFGNPSGIFGQAGSPLIDWSVPGCDALTEEVSEQATNLKAILAGARPQGEGK